MKKALLVAISAVAVAATVALADDSAKSVNAVGVVKYTIPAGGQLVCITLPLHPLETSDAEGRWIFGETSIADQLAKGSTVYFWSGTGWDNFNKNALTGKWTAAVTNRPVSIGEGIFVEAAGAAREITNVRPFDWED